MLCQNVEATDMLLHYLHLKHVWNHFNLIGEFNPDDNPNDAKWFALSGLESPLQWSHVYKAHHIGHNCHEP